MFPRRRAAGSRFVVVLKLLAIGLAVAILTCAWIVFLAKILGHYPRGRG